MAKNRSLEQKRLKNKRRNRFAVFSGATSKYATRIDRGKYQGVTHVGTPPDDDWVPSGKHVVVPVGPISLSKGVMSTGRGPNNERMAEYYARLHSYDEPLPKTIGFESQTFVGPMEELMNNLQRIIQETPKENHIKLHHDDCGQLDLFFNGMEFFFVEADFLRKFVRRSVVYKSRSTAMTMLKNHVITWVEQLPKRSSAG